MTFKYTDNNIIHITNAWHAALTIHDIYKYNAYDVGVIGQCPDGYG